MAVLTSSACVNTGLALVFLILGVISFAIAMILADADKNALCAVFVILCLATFVMSIFTGTGGLFRRADVYDYTVELNSTDQYQWLIENNYEIKKRVYDSKDIYKITGAPFPDEDWIIYPN